MHRVQHCRKYSKPGTKSETTATAPRWFAKLWFQCDSLSKAHFTMLPWEIRQIVAFVGTVVGALDGQFLSWCFHVRDWVEIEPKDWFSSYFHFYFYCLSTVVPKYLLSLAVHFFFLQYWNFLKHLVVYLD